MADRKAVNKYYPPDWDPTKGSINKHNKSHPLRHRAKKIDQGILTIRFELPYNIWCLKCDNHVAMGVRYNAEKSKVGNYYSTPIYKFRMKCHLCDNYFEIQTDPAKFDYVILSGCRKQIRESTQPEGELDLNNSSTYQEEDETKRKVTDAMFRLEKKVEDKLQSDVQLESLQSIKESVSRWTDSFAANQSLRAQYRKRRKIIESQKEKDRNLLKKASLRISLRQKTKLEDRMLAKELYTESLDQRLKQKEDNKKKGILSSSIIPKKQCVQTGSQLKREPSKNIKSNLKHNLIKKEPL